MKELMLAVNRIRAYSWSALAVMNLEKTWIIQVFDIKSEGSRTANEGSG